MATEVDVACIEIAVDTGIEVAMQVNWAATDSRAPPDDDTPYRIEKFSTLFANLP